MADHGRVPILFGKFDGIQGFSERADLVDLNQNRISNTLSDPFAKEFDIGYEQVIAHELDLCAKSRGQLLPARPVVFRAAVLDRDDWVLGTKFLIKGNEFICGFLSAIGLLEYIGVRFSIIEFAGGRIEREENVFSEFVAGFLDRFANGIEQPENTIAVVLIVLGSVDTTLRGNTVAPARRILEAKALNVISEFAQCGGRRSACEAAADNDDIKFSSVIWGNQLRFLTMLLPLVFLKGRKGPSNRVSSP
jgi:hypothetical protein